jgi:hypothetical protein
MRAPKGDAVGAYRKKLEALVPAWFEADRQLGRLLCEEGEEPPPEESIEEALGTPCSAREIERLERQLGRPLPGSYRAYLLLFGRGKKSFGSPLGPAEHGSKDVRAALGNKSALFEEFGDGDPIAAGAIPFIVDGDSRKMVLFVPPLRKTGEMDVVDYDITEEQDRFLNLSSYFEAELEGLREAVADQLKERTRRGIRTTRQAIDAVLVAHATRTPMTKTAFAAAMSRLEGKLPGGYIPTEATIEELEDAKESERFLAALRALPKLPARLLPMLAEASIDLLRDAEHRQKALPFVELMFAMKLPARGSERRDRLAAMNNALVAAFAAKEKTRAARWSDVAAKYARENPYICHSAACAYVAVGRTKEALALCRIAVETNYDHLDRLRVDRDLGPLRKTPAWKALFA